MANFYKEEEKAILACTELSKEEGFKTDNFEQFKRCELSSEFLAVRFHKRKTLHVSDVFVQHVT